VFEFLSAIQSGLCPLAVSMPKEVHTSNRPVITKGALLRVLPVQDCPKNDISVQVISQVYFYQKGKELLQQGSKTCMPLSELKPLDGYILYSLYPPPDDDSTLPLSVLMDWEDSNDCFRDELSANDESVDFYSLRWVYAMKLEHAQTALQLEQTWNIEFGRWINGRVWVNNWGRVALPLEYLHAVDIEREYSRERLNTKKQKTKATVAKGPLWSHFLGTDPLYSDVWGSPRHIDQLISLSTDWNEYCMNNHLVTNKDSCLLQIGDISWFFAQYPDPLGHRTHDRGRCIDLRLFRSDASRYEAYWNKKDDRKGFDNAYDLTLNRLFIDFLWEQDIDVVLFSDKRTHAKWAPRHNDHIHFCFSQESISE
jgi:hypothetical protein